MKKEYLLGIDVGTTGTKSMLFSAEGEILAHAYSSYESYMPAAGLCEQNAEDWWSAVVETVRSVMAGRDGNVRAISLSTQGGTILPADENFKPLSRAIVWSDTRTHEEMQDFTDVFGDGDVMYQKTGWGLGSGLPALQIRRIKKTDPELFSKTAWFLGVADYISVKMTGIPAVDLSNAGINQLIDVRAGRYDPEILNFSGLSETQLPRLISSGECIGRLSAEAAAELGLSVDTMLVAGAHDQYAALLGSGACRAGELLIGSGTSWALTMLCDKPEFASGKAISVAASSGQWGALTSLPSGGVCLEWMRKAVHGLEREELLSYKDIDRACEEVKACEEGLFFYPFGASAVGNGANSEGRVDAGAFIGVSMSQNCYSLMRAVMEGVCFEIRRMLESFTQRIDVIRFSGGASKSAFWTQLLSDVTGREVITSDIPDLACVGAAVLAGTGSGLYADSSEGYEKLAVGARSISPDAERSAIYQKAYERYCENLAYLGKIHIK